MTDADHERLIDLAKQAKGKVMICGYETGLYVELSDWNKEIVNRKEQISSSINPRETRIREVFWRNY